MSLELKKIADDLVSEFKQFREVNDQRLAEIEKKGEASGETLARFDQFQNRFDELEAQFRFVRDAKTETKSENKRSRDEELFTKSMFGKGLNRSEESEYSELMKKSMRTDIAQDGGVLSPMNYEASVIDLVVESSPVMRLARNYTIAKGDSLLVPIKSANATLGGWVSEVQAPSETSAPKLGNTVTLTAHELFAEPKVSRQMIEDGNINVESFIQSDVAQIFDQTIGSAFVNGDGASKPSGFLTGLSSNQIFRTASLSAVTADEFLRMQHKLKTFYGKRATWGISRQSIGYTRTLKATSSGDNYLWQPGLQMGAPALFLGRPYEEFPDLAAPSDAGSFAANDFVAVLADWQNFYGVLRKLGLSVLRDEMTDKPFVKYYHRMRIGGARLQSEAGVVLQTKAN
jgi:HK97 family phage major capsid protein